jgi:hypothetical protein
LVGVYLISTIFQNIDILAVFCRSLGLGVALIIDGRFEDEKKAKHQSGKSEAE